jgi:hypothetical protein
VVRSVDHALSVRRACAGIAGVGAVLTLAGCSTTQDEAARLQLNSARIRAAEVKTVVRTAGAAVQVSDVSLLSTPGAHTFVVTLHNPGAKAVTDLPISVGVSQRGRHRVYLNSRSEQELSYFYAHLPRIAAGSSVTWVFATTHAVPAKARPFALVGARPSPAVPVSATAPTIETHVTATKPAAHGREWLTVTLRNNTSVPQYQMPVYAVALRGRRTVAAGEQIVPHLGTHRSLSIRVPVQGSLQHARLNVAALPTIVH